MELKDYYAIMGVKPTDDLKTIKTAYRRLARKYHPDVSKEPDAEARFKEVAEAWEVLSDEQRRAEYDQMWQHRNDPQFNRQFHHGDGQSFNAEDFDDIFSSIFGQHARQSRQRPATRGHDIEIEVAVFLEETLTEHSRTISYNLPVYNAFGMVEREIPKTLNVKIPAGVGNGQLQPEFTEISHSGGQGVARACVGDPYHQLLTIGSLFDAGRKGSAGSQERQALLLKVWIS